MRGHATQYEKQKAASISVEIKACYKNSKFVAREAEIDAAVTRLKALAKEFDTTGQALNTP